MAFRRAIGLSRRVKKTIFLEEFAKNHYPTAQFRKDLAARLEMSEEQIQGYYYKARARVNIERKHHRPLVPVPPETIAILEAEYVKNPYATRTQDGMASLMRITGETRDRVRNWFTIRRQKQRQERTAHPESDPALPLAPRHPWRKLGNASAFAPKNLLLEETFQLCPWPLSPQIKALVEKIPDTSSVDIRTWFRRRRSSESHGTVYPATPIVAPLSERGPATAKREASLKALLKMYPDVPHSDFPTKNFWTRGTLYKHLRRLGYKPPTQP
ncbi:hypothetical protein CYLTODRAFT_450934 [Cylindrobasidium torrendii FP15055 ss-10]|uniref:Homeobox domain-containing protein n=1 Tax=Cylindrobasidium torrendii FP15055 ss-10 TaxID=1314674 RepID=A0A0D7BM61_9AGAR|nr:hypothetical protein CYLTODRAFT_450934 [Cylindrobasidium torrendii FP15055 ss-10]